jgi:hypothetical protein
MAAVTADFIMHDPGTGVTGFDAGRAGEARTFWENINLAVAPYLDVPGIELLQKQMVTVLSQLQTPGSPLTDTINRITTAPTGYGQFIIGAMRITPNNTSQAIQQAIIHSLLTPHRQIALPTCNMDAIIIKESLEHPENLAKIYKDILTGDPDISAAAHHVVLLPSNRSFLPLQQIVTTVPGTADPIRIAVRPQFPSAFDNMQYLLGPGCRGNWNTYEITEYLDRATGQCAGFNYPIHDINDAFLATFMHIVYNTNTAPLGQRPNYVTASKAFITSRELYYGIPGNAGIDHNNVLRPDTIRGSPPTFISSEFDGIKMVVNSLRPASIATVFSQPAQVAGPPRQNYSQIAGAAIYLNHLNGHIENMYMDNVRELDPGTMTDLSILRPPKTIDGTREITLAANEFCVIGDRNWLRNGEPVYLGIVRTGRNAFRLVELVKNTGDTNWKATIAKNDDKELGWLAIYTQ